MTEPMDNIAELQNDYFKRGDEAIEELRKRDQIRHRTGITSK